MIDNKNILELLKNELNNNILLKRIFIDAVDAKNSSNDDLYIQLVNTLNNTYTYIDFISLIYDINKIIEKRLNDIVNIETVLKAIEILLIKE